MKPKEPIEEAINELRRQFKEKYDVMTDVELQTLYDRLSVIMVSMNNVN